jgi:peptidoglycan hydrolase CwlO-like protein
MSNEKEIKKLQDKIDRLQKSVDELSEKLYKHIEFIDKTYDGLKNPIDAARKWLRR